MFGTLYLLDQVVTLLKPSNSLSVIFFLSIFIPFLIKSLFFKKPRTIKNFPPSPPRLPIIGNLHQLGTLPHRSLQKLSQQYGHIMLLSLGNTPTLIISSPDGAQEIMKTHDLILANRPESKIYKKLFYNLQTIGTAPYGEYWRQMKSICTLQLLSKKMVRYFSKVRKEEIVVMMNKIKDQSCCFTKPVNLSELLSSFIINVVCRAALGKKYDGGENGKFRKLMMENFELAGTGNIEDFLPFFSWVNYVNGKNARADRVAREIDEFLEEVIEDHLRHSHSKDTYGTDHEKHNRDIGEDFVDILINIHKDKEAPTTLTRDNIKAIVMDMFAAASDTSSATLDWSMAELLRNPRIIKKLQEDVRGITKGKPIIDEDDIEKMLYLKAFVKEILRFHPPAPTIVPRKSSQDVKVMGFDISAGSLVLINAWAIARDPALWDDPEDFKPDRFLNSSIESKGYDFKFIPFGYGRRGCPGIAFGMAMVEFALANIVHQINWELPFGTKVGDLDMTEYSGLVCHRKAPIFAMPIPSSS